MASDSTDRKIIQFKREPLRPGDTRLRPKGRLLIIGGHEDKEGQKDILRELARMVGNGKLVVATVASESPNSMWEMYEPVLRGLGIPHVYHLATETRADGSSARCMTVLKDANAVFFTGGDQLRITTLIGDTPVYSRIQEIFVEGGTLAGTSAGASVMSETMLVGSDSERTHRVDAALQLAPGLGFAKDMVIDQHFAERGRIGRLLAVVGQNPRVLGIGIDENTAIEVRPNRDFRVLGAGGVTVLDGRTVSFTNIAEAARGHTMSVHGVTLHMLSQGEHFDLRTRQPVQTDDAVVGDASAGRSAVSED